MKVKEKKYRFENAMNENKEKKRLKKLKESFFTKSLRKESLEKRV